jgi:multicomponent Na+:H+ antiporter subunit B
VSRPRSSPRQPASPPEPQEHEPLHRPWLGALIVLAVAGVLAVGLLTLPRETAPLPAVARYAMKIALPLWKTTEPVNEIVYGTRGFDTFGETFLLLAAVVSVIVLTREREPREGFIGEHAAGEREQAETDPKSGGGEPAARQAEQEEEGEDDDRPETPDAERLGTPAPDPALGMSVVVRTVARVVSPLLAIAGIYLAAWGYSPGGGFPGGAVILGVILLLYAGYGRKRIARVVQPKVFEPIELGGALAIIVCELLGLLVKGSFAANWLPLAPEETIRSGGILQMFSGGEFIEVATGLTLVIFAILGMRHDWTPDKDADDDQQKSRRRSR